MIVTIENITPSMAREYLESNASNRNLRKRLVERYKEEMQSGQWKTNGDPIRFRVDGVLADGQHRLTAAVESNFTLEGIVVVRGLPIDSCFTIDTGLKRTTHDQLLMSGSSFDRKLLESIKLIRLAQCGRHVNPMPIETIHEAAVRFNDAWALSGARLDNTRAIGSAPVRAAVMTFFKTKQAGWERIEDAISALNTGTAIDLNDNTLLILRNRLMTDRSFASNLGRIPAYLISQRALMAWGKRQKLNRLYVPEEAIWKIDL